MRENGYNSDDTIMHALGELNHGGRREHRENVILYSLAYLRDLGGSNCILPDIPLRCIQLTIPGIIV